MAIRNSLIEAYGLNSPGKNLLEHAGNHDYSGFNPANQTQNIQVNHDNINNYIHITQNSDSRVGAYRYVNNIEPGKIYNLSFYVYSEYSGTLQNCFETSTEIYGSNLTFNSNEWNKCWVTSKAVNKNIVFYVQNTSFKIRNIKLTECTKKDCYFFQYTDVNDELKPFVYNFKDLQTNCRYTEYFTDDNPINELISWENFKYLLKEFVEYEEWQYSDDKSYRTRNTTSIIDWCDGSNKSSVSNTEREDATIEYGTPELTLVVDDIPASGGTISNGTVSYGQSKYYVYSDTRFKVTDESGVITEGLTWGDSVTAQSLGTTIKGRSIVGSLSVSTTINGKTESTTVDVYQQANKIESYGIPTGRTLSVSDIPASGGTISRGTLGGTITQSCTYTSGSNGSLTNPTITSSSYSSSITADSLGTTIKDRTKIGTLTYTYVCNKRTGSISADVYQEANEATEITYGSWVISLNSNRYSTSTSPCPAGGGTATITRSASRTRTQHYTSGDTSTLSNETATPTLSISGTGFSLSGTTVTVNNRSNVEGGQRTASVTATISGVTKSITLYQALNKITSITATGSASSYTVMNISAGGGTVTWTPTITYSSGWSGNPPSGVTISYSSSESAAIQSGNVTTWPSRGITIGPWIGSNITISAKSAYTTKAVTGVVTTGQNLNTINDISITNGSGSTPVTSVSASGGTVEIFPRLSFSSGEYQFVLDYSKLGSWSGTGTGFTVSDITASSSTGRRIVAASRGTTIGVDRSITSTYTLNTTINGIAINKSATHKCTQAGNYVESISISGGTFSYNNISASATSASPTITGSSVYFNFTSGSKSGTAPSSTYGTYSSSASYTLESVINGFTSVSQYSGTLTSTNRGTTIGNARTSGVVTRKITVTWTPTSNYNSAGTKTDSLSLTATCTQNGNYVTSLEAVARSFSYPTIEAGATSATPSSWGGRTTFVFSSGSKTTTVPSSTYGTLSSSRIYTLGSVINGFTAVNKTTGVLTATNRGGTIGPARTSGKVTYTATMTWTPTSSYNSAGTKTASDSSTATCTQALNTIESLIMMQGMTTPVVTSFTAAGGNEQYVMDAVYTSGTRQQAAYNSNTTYSFNQSWGSWGYASSTSKYYGRLTVASREDVIGVARSGVLTGTVSGTINGVSVNKSATATITQAANTVTSIEIRSCGGATEQPTVSYPASGAGYCFSFSCRFSSGLDQEASVVDGLETWSFDQSWGTWAPTQENRWWGILTVPSRGTTIGASRSGTLTCTLKGTINGVNINTSDSVTITQALNKVVSCTETNNTLSYPSIAAGGGTSTPSGMTTARFTYSSGASGDPEGYVWTKSFSMPSGNGFSINTSSGVVTATNNTTTSSRTSNTITRTAKISYTNPASVGGDTVSATLTKTATCTQSAGAKTYANPVISLSYATIPAKGGTVTPTLSYSQTWGWNGATSGGGTITSGATVSYSGTSVNTTNGSVTAGTKGTIISNVTTVTTTTVTVKLNGKTGTKSATVQQALNTITSFTYANGAGDTPATSFSAAGGTYIYYPLFTFSSGSAGFQKTYSNSVDYSISGAGFSLGSKSNAAYSYGQYVAIASRGTTIGTARTGTLTGSIKGTINGVSINKTCSATLTQAANTITSIRIVGTGPSTPLTSLSATANTPGYSAIATFSTGTEAELNNYASYVSYSFNQSWGTWTSSGYYGILTVASRGTTIGAARSGVLTCTVKGTINGVAINKSATLSLTQALNKITALSIIPSAGATDTTSYPTGNFAASGGTKTPTTSSRVVGTFSSGSQGYTGAAGAWYGGTLTISRAWSMAAATGFSMNTSTGVVTASNRGTTVGAARTCNPKCVVSASFTNPSSVGGGVVKASSITDSFTLTQAANSMTREYSNLVGHISSTTWANKANYTSFWATGDYIERYTSGATGSSGSGDVPWDSVTVGGADWVYYDSVQGALKWYDNTGLERSTTITGRIGSWTYSVEVTQKAGMSIGRLYLHVPVNIGYVEYWNIYVNSTSGGQIWSGNPEQYGSANNILKMPEECAIIVAQNGGTVSFSTTYSTATDRNYRGSISGTEQDRLADGEDVTVYLT